MKRSSAPSTNALQEILLDKDFKFLKLSLTGSNSHGQLGQGSEEEQILCPVPINSLAVEPKVICGGGKHTILLTPNGEIFACGDNDKGQSGQEPAIKLVNSFHPLSFRLKVVKVACGWDFNVVLTEEGEVFAWGSNSFGQLGLSVKNIKYLNTPKKVFESKVSNIGAGLRHSAVVTPNGLIFTTGFGRKGQLGILVDEKIPSILDKFTLVTSIKNCKEISCGECHCVAVTANGEIFSWGNNKYGQLGVDPATTSFSATPLQIMVNKIIGNINLYSGWAHNFILTEKGQIISWGRNDFGQLGEQRQLNWRPECMNNIEKIKQVCLGSHHSVVLTEKEEVLTWGWNEHGNCGNENCNNSFQPYRLKGFSSVKLVGTGAAHSFLWSWLNMNSSSPAEILEIDNPTAEPTLANEILNTIPVIDGDGDVNYSKFFQLFLLPNRPCLIHNVTKNWPCAVNWIKDYSLNTEYFKKNFKNVDVPISDCGKREYNVQKKCSLKLFDYLNYWEEYKKCSSGLDCLYLKDWHFMKEFPCEKVYRVPSYFASDWLNEYYDNNLQLNDDYRFVYIGPKGSWTPLHADVFTSYSWSVNISGRKKWILFPPGTENYFKDSLGNLMYDVDLSSLKSNEAGKRIRSLEVIQEEGQALFVPSGWHHQVWNLEDTISVNHNWINGCNVHYVWASLKRKLSDVMKEISDCKDMENWMSQCQLLLSASFGFNYQFFHSLLEEVAKRRIDALKAKENVTVYGNWSFGKNHMKFDLKQVLKILTWIQKDDNFLEIAKTENSLNHALEFLDSLNSFLNSDEF